MGIQLFRRPAAGPPQHVRVDAATAQNGWLDIGSVHDLRVAPQVVEVGAESVLVALAGRVVVAVDDSCPHLRRPLSKGEIRGHQVRCAAHDFRWDLRNGAPVTGSCSRRLRRHVVRIEGHRILIAWPAGEPGYAEQHASHRSAHSAGWSARVG